MHIRKAEEISKANLYRSSWPQKAGDREHLRLLSSLLESPEMSYNKRIETPGFIVLVNSLDKTAAVFNRSEGIELELPKIGEIQHAIETSEAFFLISTDALIKFRKDILDAEYVAHNLDAKLLSFKSFAVVGPFVISEDDSRVVSLDSSFMPRLLEALNWSGVSELVIDESKTAIYIANESGEKAAVVSVRDLLKRNFSNVVELQFPIEGKVYSVDVYDGFFVVKYRARNLDQLYSAIVDTSQLYIKSPNGLLKAPQKFHKAKLYPYNIYAVSIKDKLSLARANDDFFAISIKAQRERFGSNFQLTIEESNAKISYLDDSAEVLSEEKIPFTVDGNFTQKLPQNVSVSVQLTNAKKLSIVHWKYDADLDKIFVADFGDSNFSDLLLKMENLKERKLISKQRSFFK